MSVMLSGVTVTVHINSSGDVDEQQLADTLNAGAAAANKCEPTIASLVCQYEQTSVDAERANIEDRIREIYREALKDVSPTNLLSLSVKLLTHLTLRHVRLDRVEHVEGSSIVLHCHVITVEALLALKQMIDSDELCQLFSDMFNLFANIEVIVTVSLSPEEFSKALSLLTSTGKCCLNVISHCLLTFLYRI